MGEASNKDLVKRIHDEINSEIERRDNLDFPLSDPFNRIKHRWIRKGSAGAALKWFDEIAKKNPDASRQRLTNLLQNRITEERLIHSAHWFTKKHLDDVLAIVRGDYKPDV